MKKEILKRLETVVNHVIATDDHSLNQLSQFEGKVICIEVTDMSLKVNITVIQQAIQLESDNDNIDVSIQGKAISLFALLAKNNNNNSFPKDITLQGDIHFAQEFQQFLRQLEIDWEELLSEYIGDIAAHQIGRFLKASVGATKHIVNSLTTSASEYARYEVEIVPDQDLIDEYSRDVETLRDDAARLKQRVQRLQMLLDKQGEN